MLPSYLLVLSEVDPIARGIRERLGPLPPADGHVDGVRLTRLSDSVWTLRRPGRHVLDDQLDRELPVALQEARVPLVFPSIHRSESGPVCFTVHPLGNLTGVAEVGGRPRSLVPTAPRLMVSALRALSGAARRVGLTATYEATHHGPLLRLPAFFVELGGGPDPEHPDPAHLDELARVIGEFVEEPADHVALGVGGGHYAPHFTELALRRRWAFGHLIPRHALAELEPATAREAWTLSTGAEGILYARAADALEPPWGEIAPRARESLAPAIPRSPDANAGT